MIFGEIFASRTMELGKEKRKQLIRLTDETTFQDVPRRIPIVMYEEDLKEMLACGAIRHSLSPWTSDVVLVQKKDGSL